MKLNEIRNFGDWMSNQGKKADAPASEPEHVKPGDDDNWSQHRGSMQKDGPFFNHIECVMDDVGHQITERHDGSVDMIIWDMKRDDAIDSEIGHSRHDVEKWCRKYGLPIPSENDFRHIGL